MRDFVKRNKKLPKPFKYIDKKEDKAKAERLAYKLQEILQPTLDQYNRMLIRNIKAIRDLKRGNILLNISNVNQMNIGEKQVNLGKNS